MAWQICRRIARALGGDLTASSDGLGKGCTLTFTVPLIEPAEAVPAEPPPPPLSPPLASSPPSPDSSPAAATAGGGEGVSVLVAEDDPLSQAVMRKVLSRLGLRCTLVGDGSAAVEAYTRGAHLAPVPHHAIYALNENITLGDRALRCGADGLAQCVAIIAVNIQDDVALTRLLSAVPIMDGLSASRAICALVSSGARPYAPIVVRLQAHSTNDVLQR